MSLIVACHTGALVSTQSGSDKLAEQAEARVWPLAGLKTSRVPALVGTFGALRQKNFTTIEEASNRFHDHWSSADSSPAVALSRSVIQSHWCRAAASAPPFALRDTSAGGHALPPPCSTSLESIHAPASGWPDQVSPEFEVVATFWPLLLAVSHMVTVLAPPGGLHPHAHFSTTCSCASTKSAFHIWCGTGKFRNDRTVPRVVPETQSPAFGPLVYHSSQYTPDRIPPKSALVGFQSPPADPSVRFHASDQVGFCDAWSVFHDGSMNTGYITDPPDSTDASGVSVTAPAAADTAITAT